MTRLNFIFSFTDQGVAKALEGFLGYFEAFSKAAQVQESSLVQLGAALRATGKDAQISVEEIADYAAELQKVTKFGDEVIIASSKWFAQMPRLDPKNMEEYQAATTDLAEVMGTNLTTAAQVLARALEDPRRASRALRRANIMLSTEERRMLEIFDEANMMAEAQAVIMNAVRASVGGAAQEMANTMEGLKGQTRGLVEDLKEHLGRMPNEFIFPVLREFKSVLQDLNDQMGETNAAALESADALAEWASSIEEWDAQTYNEYMERAVDAMNDWEAAGWTVIQVMNDIADTSQSTKAYLKGWADEFLRLSGITGFADPFEEFGGTAGTLGATGSAFESGDPVRIVLGYLKDANKEAREYGAHQRYIMQIQQDHAEDMRELRKREREEDRELKKQQADAAQAAMDRVKEQRRAWKAYVTEQRAWVERMETRGRTPAENFIESVRRLRRLEAQNLVTLEERFTIEKALVEEYWKRVGAAREEERARRAIEKSIRDEQRAQEKVQRINEKIAKERRSQRDFRSSITTLQGLWDSMAAGAVSIDTKDEEQLKALEKQRDLLWQQLVEARNTRIQAQQNMQRLQRAIQADRAGMAAVFGI